jgi:hypothetical protein
VKVKSSGVGAETATVLAPLDCPAVFAVKFVSPEYENVMTSFPTGREVVGYVAAPLVRVAVPSWVLPLKKVTVPVGVPVVVEVTVAVTVSF